MSDTTLKQAALSISTFINLKKAFSIFILLAALGPIFSVSADISGGKMSFLTQAEEALKTGSKKRADFYAARYLAVCGHTSADGCSEAELGAFLKKRQLTPKSFIPADWDPGFLEWFERISREAWNVPDERVREKFRSFEVAQNTYKNKYFVTVVAYPELELWYSLKDGIVSKAILLTMGSYRDKPMVFFGKILKGRSSFQSSPLYLDTQKRTLHYAWKPDFFDLDGDQIPEVWIRYNIAWGNGFSQILEVYRMKDERELVLIKRFQQDREGFARRLPNGDVEIGRRLSSSTAVVLASQEKHHVETWKYDSGEFKKVSEKDIPFIPTTPKWAERYS